MQNSFLKYLLIMVFLFNFIKNQTIEDYIKNFSKFSKNPMMLKLFKSTLKSQVVETMENALDTMKANKEIYKDPKKEVIDSLETNVNRYRRAKSFADEETSLVEMFNNFKDLIGMNENFVEKKKIENAMNMLIKVSQFVTEKVEILEQKLEERAAERDAEKLIASIDFDKDKVPVPVEVEGSIELSTKNDVIGTFPQTTVIVVGVVSFIFLLSLFYYCAMKSRRQEKSKTDYKKGSHAIQTTDFETV